MENTTMYEGRYMKGEAEKIEKIREEISRTGSWYKKTTVEIFDTLVAEIAKLKYWHKKIKELNPNIDIRDTYSFYGLTAKTKYYDVRNGKFFNSVNYASNYYILTEEEKKQLENLAYEDVNNIKSKIVAKKIRRLKKEAKGDISKSICLRILTLFLSVGCSIGAGICLSNSFSELYDYDKAYLKEADLETKILQEYKQEKYDDLEEKLENGEISQIQFDIDYQTISTYDFDYVYENPETIESESIKRLYSTYINNEKELSKGVLKGMGCLGGFFAFLFGAAISGNFSKFYKEDIKDEKERIYKEERNFNRTVNDYLANTTIALVPDARY